MEVDSSQAIKLFKNGKIGIFPTDTAIGIGCRMDNVSSVNRLFQIRKRPREKALIILVSSLAMAEQYVVIDAQIKKRLINKFWPGGLTLILPCYQNKVISQVRSNKDTLAVRLPDNKELVEIIDKVGVPIVAPSANFSGDMTPTKISDVNPMLISRVDFVLPGMCTMEGVSTILDTSKKPWVLVRKGIVDYE